MSRQEERTREAIFSAFFQLLSEKSFRTIRIGEITEQANIGRSTFYSHFSSKDDLLVAVCQQLFQHVFVTSSLAEHNPEEFSSEDGLEEQIAHLFQHFKENADKITTLYRLEDDYFLRSLRAELEKYLAPVLIPIHFEHSTIDSSLLKKYISETFLTVLNWWLHHQPTTPVLTVTSYYLKLLQ